MARLVDKRAIAELVGVGSRTITNWCRLGIIPFYRINSRVVRFDSDEVMNAIERCRQRGG